MHWNNSIHKILTYWRTDGLMLAKMRSSPNYWNYIFKVSEYYSVLSEKYANGWQCSLAHALHSGHWTELKYALKNRPGPTTTHSISKTILSLIKNCCTAIWIIRTYFRVHWWGDGEWSEYTVVYAKSFLRNFLIAAFD
jgi:hypothetical protein